MNTPLNAKIYERSYPYMSKDLQNVDRDWKKVVGYCNRLEIFADGTGSTFVPNYTNEYIQWTTVPELEDPDENQLIIAAIQEDIKLGNGVLSSARAIAV